MQPKVVFMDMDHTLLDNDCDVSWKEFLIDEGLAPESERADNLRYWELYCEGRLPESEFVEFQLRQIAGHSPRHIGGLAERHFRERVMERIYPQAVEAVRGYRAQGIPVLMLTATNEAIARPVADYFELDGLLATELEQQGGRYTGRIVPPYNTKQGKVERAGAWLAERQVSFESARYYGDSLPDLPMLLAVGQPRVVNPNPELRKTAEERDWPILRWKR